MIKWSTIWIVLFAFLGGGVHCQTVQRSNYSVFKTFTTNDSLLIAGGQVLTKTGGSPTIEHGYYPLNSSLLNVPEVSSQLDYQFYPNPTRSTITITRTSLSNDPIIAELYTLEGKFVMSYRIDTAIFQVDLAGLAAGIYQLSIRENSGAIYTQKLVKIN